MGGNASSEDSCTTKGGFNLKVFKKFPLLIEVGIKAGTGEKGICVRLPWMLDVSR